MATVWPVSLLTADRTTLKAPSPRIFPKVDVCSKFFVDLLFVTALLSVDVFTSEALEAVGDGEGDGGVDFVADCGAAVVSSGTLCLQPMMKFRMKLMVT